MDDRIVQPVVIRRAIPADAGLMAVLLSQLGYPASPSDVIVRLHQLETFGTAVVLVAVCEGQVVGLATGHVIPSMHHSSPVAWLTALVVAEQEAGKGIGRRLTGAVEDWARGHGAVRLGVTSGTHRDGAHAFYEHIGYERTGARFTKALGKDNPRVP